MGTFFHLDFVGWMIVIILVILSIYGWAIFLNKLRLLKSVEKTTKVFLDKFRRKDQDALQCYKEEYARLEDFSPLVRVYKAGCRELENLLRSSEVGHGTVGRSPMVKISILELESLQKTMQRIASEEILIIEKSLSVLATAASVGPLLGLLGTVWGIMDSFVGISKKGNASISAVAPGVAVALLTTVIGLLVAIPALVAYNFFQSRIGTLTVRTDNFASEFIASVEKKYVMR